MATVRPSLLKKKMHFLTKHNLVISNHIPFTGGQTLCDKVGR